MQLNRAVTTLSWRCKDIQESTKCKNIQIRLNCSDLLGQTGKLCLLYHIFLELTKFMLAFTHLTVKKSAFCAIKVRTQYNCSCVERIHTDTKRRLRGCQLPQKRTNAEVSAQLCVGCSNWPLLAHYYYTYYYLLAIVEFLPCGSDKVRR